MTSERQRIADAASDALGGISMSEAARRHGVRFDQVKRAVDRRLRPRRPSRRR